MKVNNLPLININNCYSKTDVLIKLNLPNNGKSMKLVSDYIEKHSLNTNHFGTMNKNTKYATINKECPVCNQSFVTQLGHSREKTTCSHSCSNTYFRSGINNPNHKEQSEKGYRAICFSFHKKECIVCKEQNIVEVHHYDTNHQNNTPTNLVPLCSTHHKYMHSKYEYLIKDQVDKYVETFKTTYLPN